MDPKKSKFVEEFDKSYTPPASDENKDNVELEKLRKRLEEKIQEVERLRNQNGSLVRGARAIEKTAHDAKEMGKSAYHHVADTTQYLAQRTAEHSKHGYQRTVRGAKFVYNKSVDGGQYAIDKTTHLAKNAYNRSVDGTKFVYGKTVDGAHFAYDKTTEGAKFAYDKTTEGAKFAYDKTTEGAKFAYDKTAEGAKFAYDKTTEGAKLAYGKTVEGTKFAFGKTIKGSKFVLGVTAVGAIFAVDQAAKGTKYLLRSMVKGMGKSMKFSIASMGALAKTLEHRTQKNHLSLTEDFKREFARTDMKVSEKFENFKDTTFPSMDTESQIKAINYKEYRQNHPPIENQNLENLIKKAMPNMDNMNVAAFSETKKELKQAILDKVDSILQSANQPFRNETQAIRDYDFKKLAVLDKLDKATDNALYPKDLKKAIGDYQEDRKIMKHQFIKENKNNPKVAQTREMMQNEEAFVRRTNAHKSR